MIPEVPFTCIVTRHLGGTLTIAFTSDLHEADEAFISRCRYFARECPRQPGEYEIEGKYIPETFDTDGWAEIVACRALAVDGDPLTAAKSRAEYIQNRLSCDCYWNGQEYVLSGTGWCLYVRDDRPDGPNCELLPLRTLLAIKKANRLWPNQSGGYRRLTYLSLENERRLEAAQCSR